MLPYPNTPSASGVPRTARISAAGATMTEASRAAVEKSPETSPYLRSDACALILGSSAVITEMPTIAYGSWNSM